MKDAAIVYRDLTEAKAGDGLKFVGQPARRRVERRDVAIAERFMMQPFPEPAVLELVVFHLRDVDGVFAAPMFAVIVFIPKKELVAGLVFGRSIDERVG